MRPFWRRLRDPDYRALFHGIYQTKILDTYSEMKSKYAYYDARELENAA